MFAFALTEFQSDNLGQFFLFIKIMLNPGPILPRACRSTQLGLTGRFANCSLNPITQDIEEGIEQSSPDICPRSKRSSPN